MNKKILVIGATGMLGSCLMAEFSRRDNFDVFGTVRYTKEANLLDRKVQAKIIPNIDVEKIENLLSLFNAIKPDVAINCVGFLKKPENDNDIASHILLNALLPHKLAQVSQISSTRFIHISTDSVFSGKEGNYREADSAYPQDIYSQAKLLGEVNLPNCLTLRTSIIGHGLENHSSLIDWFLSQKGSVKAWKNVIYSGLPTTELARILAEYIFPNDHLSGIYHLSSAPISKYDLLKMVAKVYRKRIKIIPDENVTLDRSLDSAKFSLETSYKPPCWEELIKKMYRYYQSNPNFIKYKR